MMQRREVVEIIQRALNDSVFTLRHSRGRGDDKPTAENVYRLVGVRTDKSALATVLVPSLIPAAGLNNDWTRSVLLLGFGQHGIVVRIDVHDCDSGSFSQPKAKCVCVGEFLGKFFGAR